MFEFLGVVYLFSVVIIIFLLMFIINVHKEYEFPLFLQNNGLYFISSVGPEIEGSSIKLGESYIF